MTGFLKASKLKTKRKAITQTHHIAYEPEWTVQLYKGEHWLATQMQRRKKISQGFITWLKVYIAQHENQTVELKEIKK